MRWATWILVVLAPLATAEPLTLTWAPVSHHFVSEDVTNEHHKGVGFKYKRFMAVTFLNSYGRRSVAAGITTPPLQLGGDWEAYLVAGAVHGYRGCYHDEGDGPTLCPFVAPGVRYTKYPVKPGALLAGDALTLTVDFTWKLP